MKRISKRIKTNFETINKGKYEIIPSEKIHETNKRIKKALKKLKQIKSNKYEQNSF